MESVAPGFARPRLDDPIPLEAQRKIAATCPGMVVAGWRTDVRAHPYWGPFRSVSTGHATDPTLRFRASSGGALSALLVHALETGLIDRVIQITADPERPARNRLTVSTTKEQILSSAGSRYGPSSPLVEIDQQLVQGGAFAFVGKPCDVSALRRLGTIDSRVELHAVLTLSFFCAGIPSFAGTKRLLAALGLEERELAAFRYRGHGWPGKATATLHDGSERQMSYAKSWGDILSKEVQFRCKICPDAVGGAADVACADAWYGDDGYPSFEEADGRSVVIGRTEIGERLVRSAATAGDLVVEALDIEQIERMQPSQARRKRLLRARIGAMAASLQAVPTMDNLLVAEAAAKAGKIEQLRSLFGTLRRIVTRRR
jgi:coenzyme F420 hydrogenase subunit beta